ncbi:FIST signal transduction protein [Pseudoalteromonas aurantia]|uniref:Histidine kinase n=1 Tax=Pseudoalteromonas aurantia TaxID=43654 RepID=A0ABY2VXB9_9GAMM|nr:FIST C-terminal domain-containing protein [Pseudoalteromonas aurantia]TMO74352.1 hypothetical protein CWC20_10450 [Pseudoalteromonas aurantia]
MTVFFSLDERNCNELKRLKDYFPNAKIVGCSSAGDITADQLFDDAMVITAFSFSNTRVAIYSDALQETAMSEFCEFAASALQKPDLKWLLVISDGHVLEEGAVILCAFYSETLKVSYACVGGWDPFGPKREITQAKGNCLYALDGEPAITLYKQYLGPYANDLPASALRFPLQVTHPETGLTMISTILDIDYEDNSMVFAGDMPHQGYAQLMKANFDRLADGAGAALMKSLESAHGDSGVALLISCVGRKLVLGPRVEEEIEALITKLSSGFKCMGFYSYGELAPDDHGGPCLLHNQTMTVTLVSE